MAKQTTGSAATEEHGGFGGRFEAELVALFQDKLLPNWKGVLLAVCAVVVLVLYLISWASRREEALKQAFSDAYGAEAVLELREIADRFRGEAPGEIAAYRIPRLLHDREKFADAAAAYAAFVKDYPDSRLACTARTGEAYAWEAAGRLAEAEEAFVAAAGLAADSVSQAEAWVGAGRCARHLGNTEQAKRYYEDAISVGPDGYFKEQAVIALREIRLSAAASAESPEAEAAVSAPPAAVEATAGGESE
jgi:tetratricopeptide (TPR) repeat protein